MVEDLENVLDRVFQDRAAQVTAGSLRRPDLGGAGRRPLTRTSLAALSAAAVAVIAIGIGVAISMGSHARIPPSTHVRVAAGVPSSPVDFSGRWLLSSVEHGGTRLNVPGGLGASIEFTAPDKLVMSDGVNTLFGRFTPTATGFTASEMGATLVGYVGSDTTRLTVIDAMGSLAFGPMTNGTSAPRVAVRATVDVGRLVLAVADYRLTFDKARGAAHATGPSATSHPG